MDNLAHALVGAAVGVLVAPQIAERHKKRFMVASAIVVNIPDIDFILRLFDGDTYHFHHRGFTHSLIGLVCMIPLGVWAFRLLMGKGFWKQAGKNFSLMQQLRLVSILLIFAHLFLDYLTSYGTMIFYPLSFERFSYPLMFIIDPLLWIIGAIGTIFLLLRRTKSQKSLQRTGAITLTVVLILWCVELGFKLQAESIYLGQAQVENPEVIRSFPPVLAPKNWLILGREHQEGKLYHQAYIDFLGGPNTRYQDQPLPEKYLHEQLCTDQKYSPEAHEYFKKVQRWSEFSACIPETDQGVSFCTCSSLKYGIIGKRELPIGKFFIAPYGRLKLDISGQE